MAYPGTLGVVTDKGIQDVKPNVLDAPTESYEIMKLRWDTGVFEVGSAQPAEPIEPPVFVDFVTYQGMTVFYQGEAVTYRYQGN